MNRATASPPKNTEDAETPTSDISRLELWEFCELVASEMGLDGQQVKPPVRLVDDLGLDSLDLLELDIVMAERGVAMPQCAWGEIVSVGDLYSWAVARSVSGDEADPTARMKQSANPLVNDGIDIYHGLRIALRPLQPADVGPLHRLLSADAGAWRWRPRGAVPGPVEFERLLWEGVLAQCAIDCLHTNQFAGLVRATRLSPHGHAYVSCYVASPRRGRGLGGEAIASFVDYLFRNWNLRYLYFELSADEMARFRRADRRWFVEYARMPGQLFVDNRPTDLVIAGIEREVWASDVAPRLETLHQLKGQ